MTRAALILFDDDDPAVSMLGVPWPAYRMRGAIRAGAKHVAVVAGRVTPQIVAAIDDAKAAGISAALARTAGEAADLFHPEESVLLLSGPAIVDDSLLAGLLSAGQPTLACVAADGEAVWELIDARARWTGLARIDGAQIRATAAMVGDWDLASTLLRQTVAAKAKRVMLSEVEPLWRVDRPEERGIAARHVVAASGDASGGWASRLVLQPVARAVALLAADRLAVVARFSPWLAALPMAAAVVLAWSRWPVLAATMVVLAFLVDALGALAERATGQAPTFLQWRGWALNGAAAAALAGIVLPPAADHGPLVIAVVLVVTVALASRLRDARDDPPWLADVPGHAAIIGIAGIFGATGLGIGLLVALLHATATLGWLQNRLSRALTQTR